MTTRNFSFVTYKAEADPWIVWEHFFPILHVLPLWIDAFGKIIEREEGTTLAYLFVLLELFGFSP